jgi:putative alpha-1,2-mannosidase
VRTCGSAFLKKGNAYVVLDGYTKMSSVKIIPEERKIVGWVYNGYFVDSSLRSYFIVQFDLPFVAYSTWENVKNTITASNQHDEGKGMGAYIQFKAGSIVQAIVTSSYISPEQAQTTFQCIVKCP